MKTIIIYLLISTVNCGNMPSRSVLSEHPDAQECETTALRIDPKKTGLKCVKSTIVDKR